MAQISEAISGTCVGGFTAHSTG